MGLSQKQVKNKSLIKSFSVISNYDSRESNFRPKRRNYRVWP